MRATETIIEQVPGGVAGEGFFIDGWSGLE
jgi:hypothetical protein